MTISTFLNQITSELNSKKAKEMAFLENLLKEDFIRELKSDVKQKVLKSLNQEKNDYLKIDINISYIHQSPKVAFDESCNPEIGDLFVCVENIFSPQKKTAKLLQFKKTDKNSIPQDNKCQLMLYKTWPKFKMKNIDYDFKDKAISYGEYCLINCNYKKENQNNWDNVLDWACHNPVTGSYTFSFSELLLKMSVMEAGEFVNSNSDNDWKNLVDTLIEIHKKNANRYREVTLNFWFFPKWNELKSLFFKISNFLKNLAVNILELFKIPIKKKTKILILHINISE